MIAINMLGQLTEQLSGRRDEGWSADHSGFCISVQTPSREGEAEGELEIRRQPLPAPEQLSWGLDIREREEAEAILLLRSRPWGRGSFLKASSSSRVMSHCQLYCLPSRPELQN